MLSKQVVQPFLPEEISFLFLFQEPLHVPLKSQQLTYWEVVEGFFNYFQLVQNYATNEDRNPSHVAHKERESSHNPDPYIHKTSAASRQELLTCQPSRNLLDPESKIDDRSQLSRSCNKKDSVEHSPPKHRTNLNLLTFQKLPVQEAFVSQLVMKYHVQYSIFSIGPKTHTSTSYLYVPRRLPSGEALLAAVEHQLHSQYSILVSFPATDTPTRRLLITRSV